MMPDQVNVLKKWSAARTGEPLGMLARLTDFKRQLFG